MVKVKEFQKENINGNKYKTPLLTDNNGVIKSTKEFLYMKATGIVRRIDDLGRAIITQKLLKIL